MRSQYCTLLKHQQQAMEETNNTNINVYKKNHHIALFAFPFGSHGTPLLNMTKLLASLSSAEHNVHYSFFSTPNSINSLFPKGGKIDLGFASVKAYEMWDGKPEEYVFKGDFMEEIELFLKAAAQPGGLKEVVEKAEEDVGLKVKCVMGDAFLWFLGDLAKEFQVPWVSCWLSGEHALSVHLYTDVLRQRFGTQGIEGREEETLDFIPGLKKVRVKDIQEGVVTGNLDSVFSKMVHKMSQVLTHANAVCISCCEELDPQIITDLKSKLSKVYTIGPLNLVLPPSKTVDTYNCLDWLHKQKANSVVYVSFGSAATPTPNELFALAEALQASGVKFLWSIKDHLKVHFPNDFLEKSRENGMVVPWVPQIEVLAHDAVGVFITHFGYNSMTESIAAEVPMIGRPFFGDHSLNGRLVEAVWEIGLQVEGHFTKDGILKSLHQILSSHEGSKMRENIKTLNGLVTKGVAPTNGSSHKNFKLLLEQELIKA